MVSRSRSGIRRTRSGSGIRRTRSGSGNRRSRSANSGARPSQIRSRSRSRAAWNHLKRHRLAYGSGAVLLGAGAAGGAYVLTRPRQNSSASVVIGPPVQQAVRPTRRANAASKYKVHLSNLEQRGRAKPQHYYLKKNSKFNAVYGVGLYEGTSHKTTNAWKKALSERGFNASNWDTA